MKSTPEMRARIRELMTNPQDDYDRAVECVLDDLDVMIASHAHISERIVDASAIRPYTWAYRYHDCVRFNGGEQVNGSRPQGSFPLFDQKAIDMAVAAERERCAKIAEPKGPRPCDCEYGACYCRNAGDAAAVASWDADMAVARAIRAPVSSPVTEKTNG